ncbi:MAG: hypothetical protein IJU50_11540, partial [Lachnospiraceae bacterium]|nr:hypothetical protein [Lachnospiraceae bacterium]
SICISTMPDILLTLSFMIFLFLASDKEKYEPYAYLVAGALSFAVGPLVAPLLTVGMPLMLGILLRTRKDKDWRSWVHILFCTSNWVIGYVGSILIKQILAYCLIRTSSGSGTEQMVMYFAPEKGLAERLDMLRYCFMGLIDPWNVKIPFLFLILILCLVLIKKRGFSLYTGFFQLLFLSFYPIGWIMIVTEHSKHFFVANILSIFIYGILNALFFSIRAGNEEKAGKGKTLVA